MLTPARALMCVTVVVWSMSLRARVECVVTRGVDTAGGRVRGLSYGGVDTFYGIPYATCQRFQPPRPYPKWRGVLFALRRFGHCAQAIGPVTLGREDCLDLDIHAPTPQPNSTRLPVLVFIHGGAYYYGTKAHYGPEFLVKKGVIVVVINYRVGVLGFLCVNGVANLGLKDQVAALNWIKKNIAAFGGDPDNVTISGQSAGASAAAMHFLAKSSKGLFHKAILMSGTPLTPWAFNVEPLKPALEDAKKLGYAQSEQDIYNNFANASLHDVLTASRDVSTNTRYFKYTPCVDTNLTDPYFHNTPLETIQSGHFNKVPIIVGSTDVEGILFYGINNHESFREWNNNFTEHLPSVFSHLPMEERLVIGDKLRQHYFGSKMIDKSAVKDVVNYYSDWLVYSTIDGFADLISKHSDQPVFRYVFAYEGWRNFAKWVFGRGLGLKGATHSDDIFYIFKPGGLSLPMTQADQLFVEIMTTLITDFMKFGHPTPPSSSLPFSWEPYQSQQRVLHLSNQPSMKPAVMLPRTRLMHNLLCNRGLPGYIACE